MFLPYKETLMNPVNPLQSQKEEVAVLLQCLIDMRLARREVYHSGLMKRWIYTLENEFVPPVLFDELYHVYRELSRMSKANRFTAAELGVVHRILKICGQYDDIEKL